MCHFLQLNAVTYHLPSGESLFSNLSATLSDQRMLLIGRNGVGKSILGKLLAGVLTPTMGTISASAPVYYLPQNYTITQNTTITDLLGITDIIAALRRIEKGIGLEEDFVTIGDHWQIESEAVALLSALDLSHRQLNDSALTLSGGEQMRLRLAGATLKHQEILILDEPSNHLDQTQKALLWQQISAFKGQVILITHDAFFLSKISSIISLDSQGLTLFQGDYQDFMDELAAKALRLNNEVVLLKQQAKKVLSTLQKQIERQQKRQQQASKNRQSQNQAAILLDAKKNKSELTSGKMRAEYIQLKAENHQAVTALSATQDTAEKITLHAYQNSEHTPKILISLKEVTLPHIEIIQTPINLIFHYGERLGIIGDNGQGKSLLLNVIAGRIPPKTGEVQQMNEGSQSITYLDQHLTYLDSAQSVLAHIEKSAKNEHWADLRMKLAQMGLSAHRIQQKSGLLSGGERLKATLALILYAQQPSPLLLLDEPTNHLDLDAKRALIALLNQYHGALLVVSHDMDFLKAIGIHEYLTPIAGKWKRSYQ